MKNIDKLLMNTAMLLCVACGDNHDTNDHQDADVVDPVSTLEKVDCIGTALTEMNAECGVFTVDSSRTVKVGFARLAAKVESQEAKPLIVLVGGPGPSGVHQGGSFKDDGSFGFMRAEREVILVDYRGVGLSKPYVGCDGEDLEVCKTAVEGSSLTFEDFRSAVFAKDIDALLAAFKIESAILWGASYGTRLALTMMRDVPSRVSHVVIDGIFPVEVNGFSQGARAPLAGLARAADRCAADTPCSNAFGDLRPKIAEIARKVANLENAAEILTVISKLGHHNATPLLVHTLATKSQAEILEILSNLLEVYDDDVHGNDAPGISDPLVGIKGDSLPMTLGIVCSEEGAFSDQQLLDIEIHALPMVVTDIFDDFIGGAPFPPSQAKGICASIGIAPAPEIELKAVKSDIPTLVLSGGVDMQTSPEWGQLVSDNLSKSTHFVFPMNDHIVTSTNLCAQNLMSQFMRAPQKQLDTSCFDMMDRKIIISTTNLLKEYGVNQ